MAGVGRTPTWRAVRGDRLSVSMAVMVTVSPPLNGSRRSRSRRAGTIESGATVAVIGSTPLSAGGEALRRLLAGGTQLRYFPKSVMEASEKGAYELYKEYMGTSKHWARIYPQWLAYRNEEIEWHRFNDNTYENYLWHSKIKAKA